MYKETESYTETERIFTSIKNRPIPIDELGQEFKDMGLSIGDMICLINRKVLTIRQVKETVGRSTINLSDTVWNMITQVESTT